MSAPGRAADRTRHPFPHGDLQMSVDFAAEADWDEVIALLTRSGLPIDGLREHFKTALVTRRDGRVVGSAALEVYEDGALLRSVAVDASRRGAGLGSDRRVVWIG